MALTLFFLLNTLLLHVRGQNETLKTKINSENKIVPKPLKFNSPPPAARAFPAPPPITATPPTTATTTSTNFQTTTTSTTILSQNEADDTDNVPLIAGICSGVLGVIIMIAIGTRASNKRFARILQWS